MSGFARRRPERLGDLDPQEVYTISELIPLTKMKRRTMNKFCNEGVFPNAVKIGRSWYIPGCDIMVCYPHLDFTG